MVDTTTTTDPADTDTATGGPAPEPPATEPPTAEPGPGPAPTPSPGGREPLLTLDGVTLRFGGVTALNDLSFEVGRGELFAVIGPNGAGKTSVFNCLSAVYKPQRGSIRLEGQELVGARPAQTARMGIGRTFQNLGLFENLDIVANLLLGRHHLMRSGFLSGAVWWGRAKREELAHRAEVEDIIDLLELSPYRRQPVGMLPYGVQKRVELGRALAMEPKLLLLDEPIAGMNLEETEDLVRYILEVHDELGMTIVLVEHDMRVVMDIADRVAVVDFGQLIALGQPEEIQNDDKVIHAYLGGS